MKHWYRESPYCVLIQHSLSPITGINSAPRKLPRKLDKLLEVARDNQASLLEEAANLPI